MTPPTKVESDETINMSLRDNYTDREQEFFSSLDQYWSDSGGSTVDKLSSFSRFVPRQSLATFLVKEKIFQNVLGVHGHIIECGVFRGGGLMAWSHFSSIYEPYNHVRRIIGFDTFEGFPEIRPDVDGATLVYKCAGGLATHAAQEVQEGIGLHDLNRPLGHIPRTHLVIGDATKSIPNFVAENKHLVVSLLYLDFDLYEPTKIAIETFWPRMPKGAVLAFDELDQKAWPGETIALMDTLGIGSLRIQRFEFNPQISFAIKE